MTQLFALNFTIRAPGGRVERLTVDADTALIGSGGHCEIRLLPEDAPVEQLFVEARSGGVFGEARSMNPAALLNGAPFTQGRLLPDSVLQIGRVQVSVTVSEQNLDAGTKKRQEKSTNPITYVAALVGFPLGFYVLFMAQNRPAPLPRPVPPPALFAASVERPCPQNAPGAAAAIAQSQLRLADARRERAPFDPKDGVAAAGLYELAASCLSIAGDRAAADRSKKQAALMQKTMNDEFHVHRVRLERALATKDYEGAKEEIRILMDFMDRDPDREPPKGAAEYTGWLASLDRQLELKFGGKKKKK
jgi:hypothetical protein